MFQHFPRFSLHRLSIDSTCSHYNMEVFPYFLASKLAFCQVVPGTARRLDDRRRLADIKKLAMGSSFKNPTKASYFYVFICHICSDLFIDVHICSYLFRFVHICSCSHMPHFCKIGASSTSIVATKPKKREEPPRGARSFQRVGRFCHVPTGSTVMKLFNSGFNSGR